MLSPDQDDLSEFAEAKGFAYINGEAIPSLVSFLETARRDLKKRTRRNLWNQLTLTVSIWRARSKSKTSDEAIARSYDQEYDGSRGRYGYASAILSREGFELITGLAAGIIPKLHIIDIGAGSNEFLRFCRDTLAVPSNQLHGSDVSSASRDIIESDGFTGHVGRIENLNLPMRTFDIAYLSYFIDYDTNQSATFDTVIDLVTSGGKIVLEGLFPVRPFAFLQEEAATYSFITKGITVKEDITLVMESFARLGKAKGRKVSLERVVKTHRFVRSHFGFYRLPSYFLTFSVED